MSQKVGGLKHFDLVALADGVYACIHKPNGGAFSNAGIVDLGDRTLVVDAMGTLAGGRELRATAETLFGRPVSALVLTHHHDDHWIGASAFGPGTLFLCTEKTRAACVPYGAELKEEYADVPPGRTSCAGWKSGLRRRRTSVGSSASEAASHVCGSRWPNSTPGRRATPT